MRALVLLLLALSVAGCGGNGDSGSERTVVAAFYPLAWAAEQLARPGTRVLNLTPPGVEPHDLELSPSDVETIRDADLLVYLAGGFQPALEDALGERQGRSLDVLDGDGDPHIWLDPVRFGRAVAAIARALDDITAARPALRRLRRLDAEYRRGLAQCERDVIVTTHAAFSHLAARYGLHQLSLAGVSPEAEPTPRELEDLVRAVQLSGAKTVFTEPLISDEVAETVAREAGVSVATLDPIEGLSQERLDAGEDYVSVMRWNLVALRKALGCR